jgi:hypothetical protein
MGRRPATRRLARAGRPFADGTGPQTQDYSTTNQPAGVAQLRRSFVKHAAPGRTRFKRSRPRNLRKQQRGFQQPRSRATVTIWNEAPGEKERMTFDWQKITENKRALRKRLAAAPIAEKLRMLDALCKRAVSIRGARFREATAVEEKSGCYGDRKEKTS